MIQRLEPNVLSPTATLAQFTKQLEETFYQTALGCFNIRKKNKNPTNGEETEPTTALSHLQRAASTPPCYTTKQPQPQAL